MSGYKSFRITLHLTHFFQDHRSVCKIFISKMKNITDLQNHVQEIFKIKDFFFMSNGHYIPSTEDIRILYPEDIVVAIPIKHNNIAMCATSTSQVSSMNLTLLKDKHKRQYLEDPEDFSKCELEDCSNMHEKKKQKTNPNVMCKNKDKLYPYKEDNIEEHNVDTHAENTNENIYENDLENNVPNKKKLNVFFGLPNLSINQSNSNISVKTKVLYFENQSLNDKLEHNNSAYKTSNFIENQEQKVNKLDFPHNDRENNSVNCLKNKKLFIHKRKLDLICYDLPKKSNIIKSVLVSNIPSNPNLSDVPSKCNSKSYIWENTSHKNMDDKFQMKYNPCISELKKPVLNNSSFFHNFETEGYQVKNNFNSEHKQVTNNDAELTLETKEAEVSNNSNCLFKNINTDMIGNLKTSNLKQYCINEEIKSISTSIKPISKLEENLEDKRISFTKKCIDNGVNVMHMNQPKQCSQTDDLNIASLIDESSQKHITTSSVGSALDYDHSLCEEYDTVPFITKRKRKCIYRNKKTNSFLNSSPISLVAQYVCDSPLSYSATPIGHINFIRNGSNPVNYTYEQKKTDILLEKVASKTIDDPSDLVAETLKSHKKIKFEQSEEKSLISNNITNAVNGEATVFDTISEDIIFKLPIMSSKPKIGDLIAFKMLRLNKNYTPELSKHIIGEILSFNEVTSNVDLKIIDGHDQCTEPGRQLFTGESNKELCCIKSYCWTSLIEPRLIFP